MVVNAIQEMTACLRTTSHCYDSIPQLQSMLPITWTVLAQNISDPDLLGNFQKAFNHFIESGQVWALLIGLIIGYMLRGLSTYG